MNHQLWSQLEYGITRCRHPDQVTCSRQRQQAAVRASAAATRATRPTWRVNFNNRNTKTSIYNASSNTTHKL